MESLKVIRLDTFTRLLISVFRTCSTELSFASETVVSTGLKSRSVSESFCSSILVLLLRSCSSYPLFKLVLS